MLSVQMAFFHDGIIAKMLPSKEISRQPINRLWQLIKQYYEMLFKNLIDFYKRKRTLCERVLLRNLYRGKACVDGAEHITDQWTKQHHDRDNDNRNQDENQCVLYQSLTFFLGCE